MARRWMLLGIALVAVLAAGGLGAQGAGTPLGVVHGDYSPCGPWDDYEKLSLSLIGQLRFGGRIYRGPVDFTSWHRLCTAATPGPVSFSGSNGGRSVSGTCSGSFTGALALLNCTGSVRYASGDEGPLSQLKIRADYIGIQYPSGCLIFDCGPFDGPVYAILGTYSRGW